jgi:hypothetical protein
MSGHVLEEAPAAAPARSPGPAASQARNPVERAVQQLWAEVLQRDTGIHDNFFSVGGASLTAQKLTTRLGAVFKVTLSPNCVFQQPTIAQLAQHLEAIEVQPGLTRKIASLLLEIESHGRL